MPECVHCGDYTSDGYTHWCNAERFSHKEHPYADTPDEPRCAMFAPGGNYGPHLREFVTWHKGRDAGRGHQWIGIWRGWCIRVYPQLDQYQGRNRIRWYADCDGRQRAFAKGSAEAAQQAACEWVDSELGL